MRTFRALLPALKTEKFTRTPQDLTLRTYYPRTAVPVISQTRHSR